MVDVVSVLGWNYVNAVFDEGNYGEKGIESFRKLAPTKSICIALSEKIRRSFQESDFVELIERLSTQTAARGVVMFVNEDNVRKILSAATRLGKRRYFFWIGSDSWGAKRAPLSQEGIDAAAHAAITIEPKRNEIKPFDRYFTSLKPNNNTRNVWFDEFWRSRFNCTGDSVCAENASLAKWHKQESYVPYVVDAVYLLAHSLKALINDSCGNTPFAICKPTITGPALLQYIRNVSFTGEQGAKVALDESGDRMGRYNVFQYDADRKEYLRVGEWIEGGELEIDESELGTKDRLKLNTSLLSAAWEKGIPASTCSHECERGKVRQYTQERCCWVCSDCNASSILPNETTCMPCPIGFLPNRDKKECIPMVPERMEWASVWAIVPATFSSLGMGATFVVIYTFVRFNKTPIIMASGRELCYFMIAGVLCSYVMTFVLLNPPSALTCGAIRLFLGLFLCAIYAAILTKTSRLARVFTGNLKTAKRPRFLTPGAQVGICSSIVGVQFVGAVIWLIVEPPGTILLYPDRLTAVLSCKTTATPLLLSLSYDGLIICLCTVYAFKTRKIPENFNETKYIGFTMYATCIVWLAFITIYFATHHNFRIRITSLCMCISISGTVTLALFFAPKVYIVLFQPEKNVRDRSAMTGFQKLVSQHITQQIRVVKEEAAQVGFSPPQRTSVAVSISPRPPTESNTFSQLSSASANELRSDDDSSLRHRVTSSGKANGARMGVGGVGFGGSILAPMRESSPLTSEPTPELQISADDKDVKNEVIEPFLGRNDSLDSFPTAEELEKKESWVVQRAEVEMILTEIVSQEGTVV